MTVQKATQDVPPGCDGIAKSTKPVLALAKVCGLTMYDVAVLLGYVIRATGEPNRIVTSLFLNGRYWPGDEKMLSLRSGFRQAQVPEPWITFAVARQYGIYMAKGGRGQRSSRGKGPPTVQLNR